MFLFVEYIVGQKEWDRRFGLVKTWDLNHSCISQSSVCVRITLLKKVCENYYDDFIQQNSE